MMWIGSTDEDKFEGTIRKYVSDNFLSKFEANCHNLQLVLPELDTTEHFAFELLRIANRSLQPVNPYDVEEGGLESAVIMSIERLYPRILDWVMLEESKSTEPTAKLPFFWYSKPHEKKVTIGTKLTYSVSVADAIGKFATFMEYYARSEFKQFILRKKFDLLIQISGTINKEHLRNIIYQLEQVQTPKVHLVLISLNDSIATGLPNLVSRTVTLRELAHQVSNRIKSPKMVAEDFEFLLGKTHFDLKLAKVVMSAYLDSGRSADPPSARSFLADNWDRILKEKGYL